MKKYSKEERLEIGKEVYSWNRTSKKRVSSTGRWSQNKIRNYQLEDLKIIIKLSNDYPIIKLCKVIGINRAYFYTLKKKYKL